MNWDNWTDKCNPVLLKEVRQFFHNRTFLILMSLLLLAELLMLLITYAQYPDMQDYNKKDLGATLFFIQLGGMTTLILLICGSLTLTRFARERRDMELDYTRLSTLRPASVIWGKLSSCLLVILFVHSLCLPFLAISYFLKGISLLSMGCLLLHFLPAYLFTAQFSIFGGSFCSKKGIEILSALLVPALIAFGVITAQALHPRTLYVAFFLLDGFILLLTAFLFLCSVSVLKASNSNRAFGPRLFSFCVVLLGTAGSFLLLLSFPHITWSSPTPNVVAVFLSLILVFAIAAICFLPFERQEPGRRVMRERPHSRLARFLAFFLTSGYPGGLAMAWLLTLLFLLPFLAACLTHLHFRFDEFFLILCFVLFYIQTSMLLIRYFPRVPKVAWVLIVLITLFLFPVLASAFATMGNNHEMKIFCIALTPFGVGRKIRIQETIFFPLLGSLMTALPLLPMVWHGFLDFMKQEDTSKELPHE